SPDRFAQSWSARPSPSSTPAYWHALQAQLLPQDLLHDLVRPAPDGTESRITRRALYSVLLHVARAAEDLQRVVGLLEGCALGHQLRHRHLADCVDAPVEEPQRVVRQGATRLQPDGHSGDAMTNNLMLPDRPPESVARER